MERMNSNSESLTKKVDGQMIILAGFFVGVAIIALTVLLNQIALSGYQVSKSELDDTKYDLSSLRAETVRTIKRAANNGWENAVKVNGTANSSEVKSAFNSNMNNFSIQIPRIYRQYGKIANVTNFNILGNDSEGYISKVSFEMSYTDGISSYYANITLENIRLTSGVYGNEHGTHVRRILLAFFDPLVVNSSGALPESITNLTVRVTDEIGNPIPFGGGADVIFTVLEKTGGGYHGYLTADPEASSPLPNIWVRQPNQNGQINIFFVHNDNCTAANFMDAVKVEIADEPAYGPVPPVNLKIKPK